MADHPSENLTLEGLVHDLNNVFETISEAADLIERDPEHQRLARAIQRGVLRGHRILSSFQATALAPHDFDGILDNAIEFAGDLFEAVNAPAVDFARQVEPGLKLRGSPAAWERVLLNLFLNASQAMGSGGRVEIAAHRRDGAIHITVLDNGPGIPDDLLEQIFQPHFSTKSASTGLGLHIVESIVSSNGGTVSAGNRNDARGARFTIEIPEA